MTTITLIKAIIPSIFAATILSCSQGGSSPSETVHGFYAACSGEDAAQARKYVDGEDGYLQIDKAPPGITMVAMGKGEFVTRIEVLAEDIRGGAATVTVRLYVVAEDKYLDEVWHLRKVSGRWKIASDQGWAQQSR